MPWTEQETTLPVNSSHDAGAGAERYRFWDVNRVIPRPSDGVISAQVRLSGGWEDMHFNKVWGKAYDGEKEGTWLKQKVSRHFNAATGHQIYKIRYMQIVSASGPEA